MIMLLKTIIAIKKTNLSLKHKEKCNELFFNKKG